jgi:hypothetical protein
MAENTQIVQAEIIGTLDNNDIEKAPRLAIPFEEQVEIIMGYSIDDGGMLERNALSELYKIYSSYNTLERIRRMAADIRQQVDNPSTPWLKNSINVRHAFIFKEGIRISGRQTELKKIRKSPKSRDFLTPAWTEKFKHTYDVYGNVFLVKDLRTNAVFNMPIDDIEMIYVDDQDEALITHIKVNPGMSWRHGIGAKRATSGKPYVIARYNNEIPDTAFYRMHDEKVKIDRNYVFYDIHAAKPFSEPLAIPPLLLSAFYCTVAARDFADTSRWRHANSLIAIKVASPTKKGAKKGVSTVAGIEKSGSIAGFTTDMTISGMGANALNVANNSAMPYLAAAAASVNIPVGQYTMTTQGLGGTAGSLVTLDAPTRAYYEGQQSIMIEFFKEILGDGIEIEFRSSSSDSDAKISAAIMSALASHVFHPDEIRKNYEDRYDMELLHAGAPTADEWQTYYPTAVPDSTSPGKQSSKDVRDSGHDGEPDKQTGGEN